MLFLADNLPVPSLRRFQDREEVFDPCRKKWVALTPEEWVRQQVLTQLIHVLLVPTSWIAVEKEIEVNKLRKRFDVLIYDGQGNPFCMIECKAPEVPLTTSVLDQLLRYHLQVPVPYLIISNGTQTKGWCKSDGELVELADWPLIRK